MAGLTREKSGILTATWRATDGRRLAVSTGETLEERALPKAAALEAEHRFWEEQGETTWQRLADAGFSPRYLHNIFVCARHIPFPRFRKLLVEAGIRFLPPSQWRDRARPKGHPSSRKWRFRGGSKTLEELMEYAADGLTKAAVRHRVTSGWEIETALTTPLMSRADAGLKGAKTVNNRPRK